MAIGLSPNYRSVYPQDQAQVSFTKSAGSATGMPQQNPAVVDQTMIQGGAQLPESRLGSFPAASQSFSSMPYGNASAYGNADTMAYSSSPMSGGLNDAFASQNTYGAADPFQSQYMDPASQSQYMDPVSQSQYMDPASQSQYADPASQSQYMDPASQSQYADPASQSQYTDQASQSQSTDETASASTGAPTEGSPAMAISDAPLQADATDGARNTYISNLGDSLSAFGIGKKDIENNSAYADLKGKVSYDDKGGVKDMRSGLQGLDNDHLSKLAAGFKGDQVRNTVIDLVAKKLETAGQTYADSVKTLQGFTNDQLASVVKG